MKPFPKFVGWIATAAGVLAPIGSFLNLVKPSWAVLVTGASTLLAALSHSLIGTDGAPPK